MARLTPKWGRRSDHDVDETLPGGTRVRGFLDRRFSGVLTAFLENFTEGDDLGAACTVLWRGDRVVDLWGGVRDARTGDQWEHDTRVLVYSCSKGILALCLGMLVDRDLLELDAPVTRYWPEFGRGGKARTTVRMLATHTLGVLYPVPASSRAEVLAWDPMVRWLENAPPLWEPGTDSEYHAHTHGWLLGELIVRITGIHPREFLQREVATPLGLAMSYGVVSADIPALARIEPPLPWADADDYAVYLTLIAEHPHMLPTLTMAGALPFPGFGGDETYNSADVLTAELPAANLVTSARDLATAYSAAVTETAGVRLVSDRVVREMSTFTHGGDGRSVITPLHRWGTGFQLDSPPFRAMVGPTSFGHDGAGGNLGFGDLARAIGFGYVTNQMGGVPDERSNSLVRALVEALDRVDLP